MKPPEITANAAVPEMRLDKWLKAARIYKTREEAGQACDLSRVKVNDQVAKPSKVVHVGDVIVVKVTNHYRTLEIKAIPQRGLSAKDAKLVYHETTPELPPETVELMKLFKEQARQLPSPEKGRPTKKSRREMERWRGKA